METIGNTILAAIFITFYIWGVVEVRMFVSKRVKKYIKALKKERKAQLRSFE